LEWGTDPHFMITPRAWSPHFSDQSYANGRRALPDGRVRPVGVASALSFLQCFDAYLACKETCSNPIVPAVLSWGPGPPCTVTAEEKTGCKKSKRSKNFVKSRIACRVVIIFCYQCRSRDWQCLLNGPDNPQKLSISLVVSGSPSNT